MTGPPDDAGELAVTVTDGVATLWLNRPEKRNAVTYEMWQGIAEACAPLAPDPSVRLLVLRGVGAHFCAGADIAGLGRVPLEEYHRANRIADQAIADFPKPTIAYISGACVGGGAEIAIACDLRLADTTARFGITPARLGIVYPGFAVERAVRLIGASALKHLLFSAEIIDADRALRIGLIDELLTPETARPRLEQLVSLLAHERSLLTQMASKETVDAIVHTGAVDPEIERRWAEEVVASGESAEGIAAFAERRAPRFSWAPSSPSDVHDHGAL